MTLVEIATQELRFLTRDYGFRVADATSDTITHESDSAHVEASLDDMEVARPDPAATRRLFHFAAISLQKDDAILRDCQPPKESIHSFRHAGMTLVLRIGPRSEND